MSAEIAESRVGPRDLSELRVLNVGCGPIRMEGALGVDRDPGCGADVIHDLNTYPWPFEDDRFYCVVLSHVLEHLDDPDRALREARRVCWVCGEIRVVTPHFSSYESYGDITHRFHFGLTTFKPYYAPSAPFGSGERTSKPLFQLLSRRLRFGSSPLSWPGRLISGISFDLYEKYFPFLFPARNMEFVLQVLK